MKICDYCEAAKDTFHKCTMATEDAHSDDYCECYCNDDDAGEDDVEIIINSRPKSPFDILLVVVVIAGIIAFAVFQRFNE